MFHDRSLFNTIESDKFDMCTLMRIVRLAHDGEASVTNSDELVIRNGNEVVRITGISKLSGSIKVQKS